MPDLQLLLDQEECKIRMNVEDFKRDAAILMTNHQDVASFKVNALSISNLASDQVHILDWLLLKTPNLKDL